MVGVVLFTRVTLPPCGYWIKSAMTEVEEVGVVLFTRTPYPSGLRIKSAMTEVEEVGVVLFTLCSQCQALGQALISSPIKGEGDSVGCFGLLYAHPVDTALKPV